MEVAKIKYVCGFCFDYSRQNVVLIRKNRPDWQKGFLNGVGGHIEETDKTIEDSMSREFLEETGLVVWSWNLFCTYEGDGYVVYFLKAFVKDLSKVKSVTDETVSVYQISELNKGEIKTLENLNWLIPLAIDRNVDKTNCKEYAKG